jgi:hypothetical protein
MNENEGIGFPDTSALRTDKIMGYHTLQIFWKIFPSSHHGDGSDALTDKGLFPILFVTPKP